MCRFETVIVCYQICRGLFFAAIRANWETVVGGQVSQ